MTEVLADTNTRRRVAALAAFGYNDQVIGDALLLSLEMVALVKTTEEYKNAYAEKLKERAERICDIEEGWDAIEEKAIERTLEALRFSTDPRFALQAAAVANRAQRRAPQQNKVLDATRTAKVVVLTLNKTYVNGNQTTEERGMITIEQGKAGETPRRRADLPTPAKVSELLRVSPAQRAELDFNETMSELEELAERNGIDASLLE